ncbi:MAG TPA: dihydrofolate reductase family protein [Streptosporangiaceae bacterium]|jgi:dihydrofolate reductase
MRKLVLRIFDCSIDGVIAEEDTAFFDYCRELPDDPAQLARTNSFYSRADLHILGRKHYEGAAAYFAAPVDHPYAEVFNAAPKVVFSSTLQDAAWANTTIASGDLATEVEKLKHDGDGYIVGHGGITFWRSLISLGLVDGYRLTVFPYLVGRGRRLLDGLDGGQPFELVSSTPFSNGTTEVELARPN